jgi:hypothetical protein
MRKSIISDPEDLHDFVAQVVDHLDAQLEYYSRPDAHAPAVGMQVDSVQPASGAGLDLGDFSGIFPNFDICQPFGKSNVNCPSVIEGITEPPQRDSDLTG